MTASAPAAAQLPYKIIANDLVKPDLDDRDYRIIRLPNNLEVLLIHDTQTEKAAASIDVHVGSINDPANLQGLAHFCEHLLFMGTSKFPKENEYSSYLGDHSGRSNAYTASHSTNYYFEVSTNYLDGALDRFSQFFINPLFSQDGQDREINAINSENDKNLDNDSWRLHQLEKATANLSHPYTKFSTGNLETLQKDPLQRGIDARDELLKWYNTHYSANIMKLCILSNHSLDEMSQFAAKYFTAIEDKNVKLDKINQVAESTSLLTPAQLGKIIKVKPVKNIKRVQVRFFVQLDEEQDFHFRPGACISYLMGHESKGSLLYYFKVIKNWAVDLTTSLRAVCNNNYLFDCEVETTDEGLANTDNIIKSVFQYINYLKTLKEDDFRQVFEELVEVSKVHFKFREKSNFIMNTVANYAATMQEKFLTDETKNLLLNFHCSFNKKFNFKSIQKTLEMLNEKSFMVYIVNHHINDSELPLKERWYGSKYSVENMNSDLIQSIKQASLNTHLHLPPLPNPFIPKDFSIKTEDLRGTKSKTRPLLLEKTNVFEYWVKKDDRFFVPKGSVRVFFALPNTLFTPVNSILTTIFNELVIFKLNDELYQSSLVSLRGEVFTNSKGIELLVSGFSDKVPVLLKKLLQGIVDFQNDKDFNNPTKFKLIKDNVTKRLKNIKFTDPYAQIASSSYVLLQENMWSSKHKLEYLVNEDGSNNDDYINYETFNHFTKLLFKQFYLSVLTHGNFDDKEILGIKNIIKTDFIDKVNYKNLSSVQGLNFKSRTAMLNQGSISRYEEDVDNVNSCVLYFYQIDELYKIYADLQHQNDTQDSGKLIVLADLFKVVSREPLFDQLRTKEQLGYVVFSSVQNTRTMVGFRVLVQSSVKSSYYLEYRIKDFLHNGLKKLIYEMTDEEFTKKVESLASSYKNKLKYKNLNDEGSTYANKIYGNFYNFNITNLKLKNLVKVTKNDLVVFFEKYFLSEFTSKRLVVHYKGRNEKTRLEEGTTDENIPEEYPQGANIDDIIEFRSCLHMSTSGKPIINLDYYKTYNEEEEEGLLDPKL